MGIDVSVEKARKAVFLIFRCHDYDPHRVDGTFWKLVTGPKMLSIRFGTKKKHSPVNSGGVKGPPIV